MCWRLCRLREYVSNQQDSTEVRSPVHIDDAYVQTKKIPYLSTAPASVSADRTYVPPFVSEWVTV